jgi:hypothetical protein
MRFKNAVRAAFVFLIFSLFPVCGDLDSMIYSEGIYQVKVLVNENPLENCAILRADDKISPNFASLSENDPDLAGLLVYVCNADGEIIGGKVKYEFRSRTSAIEADIIIPVASFKDEMPYFPLSEDIEMGMYSLVFDVLGKKGTLSHSALDFYCLGSAEFNPNDISVYLPGESGSGLIPAGTRIMLETNLDFDSKFDPYVIWYDGKKIISEGMVSDGAGSILWDVPEQAGFYSVRLEIFPFKLDRKIAGIFREITLPVSAKAENAGHLSEVDSDADGYNQLPAILSQLEQQVQTDITDTDVTEENGAEEEIQEEENTEKETEIEKEEVAEEVEERKELRPELLRWYQFKGNLYDSIALPGTEQALKPAGNKPPRWAAAGGRYGLSTGPNDSYTVSPIHFLRDGQDSGGGIFLFRIKPVTEGTIVSVFFPHKSSGGGVWMDMAKTGNAVVLRLISGDNIAVEIPVNLGHTTGAALVPVTVEFFIRQDSLEAKLSLGEGNSRYSLAGSIGLPDALTGEARISLGGNYLHSDAEYSPEVKSLAESAVYEPGKVSTMTIQQESIDEPLSGGDGASKNSGATIWGEFAILHTTAPFIRSMIPVPVTEKTDQITPEAKPDGAGAAKTTVVRVEAQVERRQVNPVPEETTEPALLLTPPEETDTDDGQIQQKRDDIEKHPMSEKDDDLDI